MAEETGIPRSKMISCKNVHEARYTLICSIFFECFRASQPHDETKNLICVVYSLIIFLSSSIAVKSPKTSV